MKTNLWLLFLLSLAFSVAAQDNVTSDSPGGSASETVVESVPLETLKKGKVAVTVAVFFITLGASFLPWWMGRSKHALLAINFGSCFAGGIVIGLALCHLFSDATSGFANYFDLAGTNGLWYIDNVDYPFAGLIAGFILLLLLLVENIASTHAHVHDLQEGGDEGHGHNHGYPESHHSMTPHPGISSHPETLSSDVTNLNAVSNMVQTMQSTSHCGDITASEVRMISSRYGPNNVICIEPEVCPAELCVRNNDDRADPSKHGKQEVVRGGKEQVVRAWTFFIAMSLHSIFDGLAIGAEAKFNQFVMFVIAILIHKFFDGFVVGVALYLGRLSWTHTISGLLFCASMTPIGIGIGWALTDGATGAAAQLITGVIFSVSLGTFLFISLVELLPQGLADSKYRPAKIILAVVGFGVMALIAIWA